MKLHRLTILIAEDDENDRFLLQRAIERQGIDHEIHLVPNGAEAIEYLAARGKYSDRERYQFPNLLVVDIKMPFRTGLEVLQWLHDHEDCSVVPVIVFSSSALPEDIRKSFRLGAHGFFTKPADMAQLGSTLKLIFDYWFLSHVPDAPATRRCL